MKLVIDGHETELPPTKVRLRLDPGQKGITMEAYVSRTWQPICTLREDGILGLWDARNKGLAGAGFQMTEINLASNSRIKTTTQ